MTVQELYDSIGGNYNGAKSILQMDKLIGKFIIKFLDEKSYERLTAAWASRDAEGVFEAAHAMKGVCANLGLDELSHRASDLSEEFRPTHDRTMDDAEVERLMGELDGLYQRSIDGIRAFAAEQ